jgi:hypothetical protein
MKNEKKKKRSCILRESELIIKNKNKTEALPSSFHLAIILDVKPIPPPKSNTKQILGDYSMLFDKLN